MHRPAFRTSIYAFALIVVVALVAVTMLPRQPGRMTFALAASTGCSSLVVVGVRGSGEAFSSGEHGMGPEVYAAYQQISNRVHDAQPVGLPYPATPPIPITNLNSAYWASVSTGDVMMANYLARITATCPTQRIALVGYSQGAEVIGDTLKNLSATEQSLVAEIVLFGDPVFNPSISAIDRGTYNPKLEGVLGARTIAALWYPKMRDYCALHDPFCNYTAWDLVHCAPGSNCPHYHYVTSGTAAFAGALVGNAIAALPLLTQSQPPTASPPARTNPPASYRHYVYHTCANGHCGLHARTGPGYTNYGITRTLYDGDTVDITCQTTGESVSGIDGSSSNVWDKLVQGDYVADFYVNTPGMTGAFSPPIPHC